MTYTRIIVFHEQQSPKSSWFEYNNWIAFLLRINFQQHYIFKIVFFLLKQYVIYTLIRDEATLVKLNENIFLINLHFFKNCYNYVFEMLMTFIDLVGQIKYCGS